MSKTLYDKPCNKCGVRITMRQGADAKWHPFEFQSNEAHRCGQTSTPQPPTNATAGKVTEQQTVGPAPVIVGGMTQDLEKWITNIVKTAVREAIKEEFEK